MHQQQIIDDVLARLPLTGVEVICVTLTASPDVLKERICRDIPAGLRDENAIARALAYLPLYDAVQSIKVNSSALSAAELAGQIREIGEMNE